VALLEMILNFIGVYPGADISTTGADLCEKFML